MQQVCANRAALEGVTTHLDTLATRKKAAHNFFFDARSRLEHSQSYLTVRPRRVCFRQCVLAADICYSPAPRSEQRDQCQHYSGPRLKPRKSLPPPRTQKLHYGYQITERWSETCTDRIFDAVLMKEAQSNTLVGADEDLVANAVVLCQAVERVVRLPHASDPPAERVRLVVVRVPPVLVDLCGLAASVLRGIVAKIGSAIAKIGSALATGGRAQPEPTICA